jgi:glyoxylase-like metal-dependent hydrolase (beta-lactamase superfamily II)
MKVFPLRVGATKVPYGQFYGGLQGWNGPRGFVRFATDKSHYIWVPIHAYLIEHPTAGPILVDTGISWVQSHAHEEYYAGTLHYVLDNDEYELPLDQELIKGLARHGYRPSDISTVILTHLHEDHTGGLRDLPNARVVISRAEWNGRFTKAFGVVPINYQPSLAGVRNWDLVDYTSGPLASFTASEDLFADGSVVLLPTPGHTPGHQCVLLSMDGYELLITGDILYTLRHLAVDQVQALQMGRTPQRQQVDSIHRIRGLRRALPNMVLATLHDHTSYQFNYLVPFLADGGLSSEERRAIKAYERTLFDASDNLLPAAMPSFIPSVDGGPVGSVSGSEAPALRSSASAAA